MHGVVLPPFVADMAARGRLGRDGVFVDVGSGVGNVVLQVVPIHTCLVPLASFSSCHPCMRVDRHDI